MPSTSPTRARRAGCSIGSAGPRPRPVSTGISPGYRVSSGHRPSPSRLDATSVDRLGHALVGRDAGAAQVLQPAQHVVVPPGREGEARPRGAALAISLDHLAGRPPAEEPALEEVLLPAQTGLGHLRAAPDGPFVLEQGLQHADRGVERRPRRAVLSLAVPAAVGQLLGEQPVDDAPDRTSGASSTGCSASSCPTAAGTARPRTARRGRRSTPRSACWKPCSSTNGPAGAARR